MIKKNNKKYTYSFLFSFIFAVVFFSFFTRTNIAHASFSMGRSTSVTTNAATSITSTSAVLNAGVTVGSSDTVINVGFSYTGGSWGNSVSYTSGASYTYSYTLTGLSACTSYSFTASVTGSTMSYIGSTVTFTTAGCGAGVVAGTFSQGISGYAGSGTATGIVTSMGTYTLLYGAYEIQPTSTSSVGFWEASIPVSATTTTYSESGLFCGNYQIRPVLILTPYFYDTSNIVATGSWITPGPCLGVSTGSATQVSPTSETITGTVTGINSQVATVGFSGSFGSSVTAGTRAVSWGAGGSLAPSVPFSTTLTGLTCGTTYTYRATISDSMYSATGTMLSFATTCSPPTVTTTGSSAVTDSSASLSGAITAIPGTNPTIVGFQYGLDTTYGSVSSNSGYFYVGPFTQSVTGLACSTTYHYRAFASGGYGSDKTFTTGTCTGSNGNVSGYVWSSNVGWISLDCAHGSSTGGSVCGTSSYSVNVTPNTTTQQGLFSGYAWSPTIGWISFNPSDLSSCGAGSSTQARVNLATGTSTTGFISGWAKALSFGSTSAGCINLRGTVTGSSTTYGVYYNSATSTNNMSGMPGYTSYAWGGSTIGWISWPTANLNLAAPTLAMTINGGSSASFTSAGGTASLVWTATNMMASNCTASSSAGDWTGPVSSGGGSQLLTFNPNTTTSTITKTYTIGSCSSISGAPVTPVTVTVTIAAAGASTLSFKANGSGDTTPLVISPGDPVTLEWQVQNIAGGACTGTSTSPSGAISGWNSTAKAPLSGVASTSTTITYDEVINPPATSTRAYTINCGSVAKTVNITVSTSTTLGTPSLSFTVNGATSTSFESSGGNITLQWITENLDPSDCTASSSDSSWSGFKSYLGGTDTLTIASNTTTSTKTISYTLSNCLNNGNVLPPQTVTVVVPGTTTPYLSLTANGESSATIDSGTSVTLAWQVANISASCIGTSSGTGSPYTYWAGGTKPPTSSSLTPNESYDGTSYYETIGADGSITSNRTYTITCGTFSDTVNIIVNPAGPGNVSLSVSDDSFPSTGGTRTATLSWVTSGLDTNDCTANSSAGDWTGTASYLGGTFGLTIPTNSTTSTVTRTYTISNCTSAGVVLPSQTVTVTIGAGGTNPYLSFVASNGTVTGDDISVSPTDPVTLSWQMQNISAGSCHGTSDGSYTGWTNTLKHPLSADGSVGSTPVTYTESVGTSTTERAYSITCTGTNGAVVYQTVTINVSSSTINSGCTNVCYRDTASMDLTVNGDPSITLPPTATSATLVWAGLHLDTTGCVASSNPSSSWTGPQSSSGSYTLSFTPTTATSATPHTYTISGCTSAVDSSVLSPVTVTVTIAPAGTPSLLSFLVNGSSSATIDTGTPVTLSWQVQNIGTGSYCHGTTSGSSISGWGGDLKSPTTAMTTAQTYYNYNVGSDGSITNTRTFTLNCGTAGTQTVMVTVNPVIVIPPCVGFACTSGGSLIPPSLKIFKLPPWLEI